jgi:hypothetical protein
MRWLIPFILLFIPVALPAQERIIKTDLGDQWKEFDQGKFTPHSGNFRAVHLFLSDSWRGGTLEISSPEEMGIFINYKLVLRKPGLIRLPVDSLLSRYPVHTVISVYAAGRPPSLKTFLIRQQSISEFDNPLREPEHFHDFVILAALLLFGFFAILFRTQTSLTLDYFNFFKVFSIQAREEAITTGRIGSSANLFFFAFISLLASLIFLIAHRVGVESLSASALAINSVGKGIIYWLLLAAVIMLLLFVKLFLVWLLSTLFNFRDVVRFQFFSFVRSLYVGVIMMGFFALVYFIGSFQSVWYFYYLLAGMCILLMTSNLFLYIKLMTRVATSHFHLFSYLCGSEIIPLMILTKVLLF